MKARNGSDLGLILNMIRIPLSMVFPLFFGDDDGDSSSQGAAA
jgi:hypothetical protein